MWGCEGCGSIYMGMILLCMREAERIVSATLLLHAVRAVSATLLHALCAVSATLLHALCVVSATLLHALRVVKRRVQKLMTCRK